MDNKDMIKLLQQDLGREYEAMNFYLQCSFSVRGYRRGYLKGWLREQATEELGHAIQIADKIASLGGVPTTTIPAVQGLTDAVEILRHALTYELAVVKNFKQRAADADKLGDVHLRLLLEEQLAESQGEAEEIRKLLEH